MLVDEVDDSASDLSSCAVVADARLDNHFDRTAESLVPLFDELRVLLERHDVVGVAANVQEGHLQLCQRGEVVDRVELIGQGLGLGEAVGVETAFPIAGEPLPLPRPPGQLLKSQTGASL